MIEDLWNKLPLPMQLAVLSSVTAIVTSCIAAASGILQTLIKERPRVVRSLAFGCFSLVLFTLVSCIAYYVTGDALQRKAAEEAPEPTPPAPSKPAPYVDAPIAAPTPSEVSPLFPLLTAETPDRLAKVTHRGTIQGTMWRAAELTNSTGQSLVYEEWTPLNGWQASEIPAGKTMGIRKDDNSEILIRFPEDREGAIFSVGSTVLWDHSPTESERTLIGPVYIYRVGGKMLLLAKQAAETNG